MQLWGSIVMYCNVVYCVVFYCNSLYCFVLCCIVCVRGRVYVRVHMSACMRECVRACRANYVGVYARMSVGGWCDSDASPSPNRKIVSFCLSRGWSINARNRTLSGGVSR